MIPNISSHSIILIGIGGGGLNVPILLVVYGFDYHTSVVLSLATVLGNYISQVSQHVITESYVMMYWEYLNI